MWSLTKFFHSIILSTTDSFMSLSVIDKPQATPGFFGNTNNAKLITEEVTGEEFVATLTNVSIDIKIEEYVCSL